MDTFLAIASKREVRQYADRPLPDDAIRRILDAGRVAGSSQNRQNRRFIATRDRGLLERLAPCVYTPTNVLGSALAVAIVIAGKGPTAFDAGRAGQNMMLAAWNDGVASYPNGLPDPAPVGKLLDLGEGERVVIVLSFGFPHGARDPAARTPEEWAARADRRPLEEVAERL